MNPLALASPDCDAIVGGPPNFGSMAPSQGCVIPDTSAAANSWLEEYILRNWHDVIALQSPSGLAYDDEDHQLSLTEQDLASLMSQQRMAAANAAMAGLAYDDEDHQLSLTEQDVMNQQRMAAANAAMAASLDETGQVPESFPRTSSDVSAADDGDDCKGHGSWEMVSDPDCEWEADGSIDRRRRFCL